MTNTESPSGVGFDKPASWDEAYEHDEHDEQQITEADIRELALYELDSDKQTLVGLGPVERARRSRRTAEIPESQRAPLSESPGPFIADDEIPASLRGRKLAPWAVVASAFLLVAIALLLVVSALAPGAPRASAAHPAAAAVPSPRDVSSPIGDVNPPPADVAPTTTVAQPTDAAAPNEAVAPSTEAASSTEAAAKNESVSSSEPTASTEHARVAASVPALPVKLADVPRANTVDLSTADDPSVGNIDVTSNPPANVVLDGRPVGKAPRLVRVPAGVHKLVFIHPLYGRKSVVVNVIPGVTARASADF